MENILTALEVAIYVLRKAKKEKLKINLRKLQWIVYKSHCNHLTRYYKILFDQKIKAETQFVTIPVLKKIYSPYKEKTNIKSCQKFFKDIYSKNQKKSINLAYKQFIKMTDYQIVEAISNDIPWLIVWKRRRYDHASITNRIICLKKDV